MKFKKRTIVASMVALLGYNIHTASALETTFKVAVVKDAVGTNNIVTGDYATGLMELKTKEDVSFEHNIGLCVSHLKLGQLSDAEKACSSAITHKTKYLSKAKGKALIAYAYNNRAIVRYLSNNVAGAKSDFDKAKTLNGDRLISENVDLFFNKIVSTVDSSFDDLKSE